MEVVLAKIEEILKRQEEMGKYQREMNGRVAIHQSWIDRREREIDATDDRFKMVEESIDQQQSWIDRTQSRVIEEFDQMRETLAGHERYIEGQKAAKEGLWVVVKEWALIIGMMATLLKVFKVLP